MLSVLQKIHRSFYLRAQLTHSWSRIYSIFPYINNKVQITSFLRATMMFAVFLRATMMFDDVNCWPDRIYICQIRNKWHKPLWRIINSKIRMTTSTVTKNCEFVSVITCSFFYIYQNIQRNVKSESKKVKKTKNKKKNQLQKTQQRESQLR